MDTAADPAGVIAGKSLRAAPRERDRHSTAWAGFTIGARSSVQGPAFCRTRKPSRAHRHALPALRDLVLQTRPYAAEAPLERGLTRA